MIEQHGMIICAFPGTGKTKAEATAHNYGLYEILDAESSPFRWTETASGKRVQNPEFPDNYLNFIEHEAGIKERIILTATHKQVRDEMKKRGLSYIIIAPEKNLKDEYLSRYVARGNDISFIKQLYDHWNEWLDEMEGDGAPIIHLKSGQYLLDIILPKLTTSRGRTAYHCGDGKTYYL